jgi:hypothetical protein
VVLVGHSSALCCVGAGSLNVLALLLHVD